MTHDQNPCGNPEEELNLARCDAEYAFQVLKLAFRIWHSIDARDFDFTIFEEDLQVNEEHGNLSFNDQFFRSKEELTKVAWFNVMAAFAASAIALDNYFEAVKGQRQPGSDEPIHCLWAVVYAVRNAFAHGIAKPKWHVKNTEYQREFRIDLNGETILLDLKKLNETKLCFEHFNGLYGWHRIRDQSLALLKTA